MNNSNFNNSSSRHHNPDTDSGYNKFTHRTSNNGNAGHAKITDLNNEERERLMQDNLSDKTLKTIMDFHSERA